jgi:uncharacterized membrane protein
MTLVGKFHPLLVHFPIALVLAAAAAELVVFTTARLAWRTVAVANLRAGAAIAVVTTITGWLLAWSPVVDATPTLEWHRWIGMAGALGAVGAALMSFGLHVQSHRSVFTYRVTLFGAALLVAIAGHLGGSLVWGSQFLRP